MKTLVLANQKGGVGKSAVVCQLAHYFNANGRRTLVIDLDHQMNTSSSLSKSSKVAQASFNSSQLLQGGSGPLPDGSFVLIAGDESLGALERQPEKHGVIAGALVDFLEASADRFDVCVLDTNPNPDIRYAAALIASNYLLSPVQLNQEAIDGIRALLHHSRYGYHKIKQVLNPGLELIGLLPNLVEATPFQKKNLQDLVAKHMELLIPVAGSFARIPTRTAIAEAQAEGVYIADMKKTSARDALKELLVSFDAIAKRMNLESPHGDTIT